MEIISTTNSVPLLKTRVILAEEKDKDKSKEDLFYSVFMLTGIIVCLILSLF